MNDGKSAIFIFDDPYCECDRIKRDYFAGAGCEDAQRFAEMISTVKGTIRVAQRDGLWIDDGLPGASESREERAS